jgi:putative ABC transport system permease protein
MPIWRDLLLAARSLAKSRAFTFVCVVSLGIGMAPVIAVQYGSRIFTTPPPGLHTDTLVELVTAPVGPRQADDKWSYADFTDLRDANTGITLVGWAMGESAVTLPDSGGQRTSAQTMFVSANYFETMGKAMVRGPGFRETAEPVAVLGFKFWQTRLASDRDVVGKVLPVQGVPHVVAGIAPEHFGGHLPFHDTEIFLPLDRHPRVLAGAGARYDRSQPWVRIHGRLAPGVTMEQARTAVATLTAELARQHPSTNELVAGTVAPYHTIGNVEGQDANVVLALFQTLTIIPLLVVCLNVSGMVQVRSAMRERELTIRQAIGASRRRLVQHLLAESIVLAAGGATLAALVLFNAPGLIAWWLGEPMSPQLQQALRVDASMIAICAGVCLATSLVCGWLPAIRFSRPAIMTVLKDESGSGGIRAGRVHRVTSALQVAIAVPLLVLSAVSLERVRATATSDLGFAADQLYAARISLRADTGEDAGFQIRRVSDNLAQTSGVAAVTVADGLPLDFRYRMTKVSSQLDPNAAPIDVLAHVTRVGDNYLDTLAIPLLRGRGFTSADVAGAQLVTIVSKALADKLFPGADGIGQRITFESSGEKDPAPKTLTIVGVTADFPTSQMSTDREQLLLPLAQHPDVRKDSVQIFDDRGNAPALMLVARSAPGEAPAKLHTAVENAIRAHDPDFDRTTIITGVWLRQNSMDDFLNQSAVGGITGGVALVLAALGIYGVVGLMVATRTREIAVRVTLGASRVRVMGMILLDVIKLVAPGVGAGLLITLAVTRLDTGIALSNIEPLAYVAGAVIALLTAVLAGLAPARRAASVEPMVAMRST